MALESSYRSAGVTMSLNSHVVKSTVVAALGGLLFGFDTVVISGTTSALKATFSLSEWGLGSRSAAPCSAPFWVAMFSSIPVTMGPQEEPDADGGALLYLALGLRFRLGLEPRCWSFASSGGWALAGLPVLGPMYIAEIHRRAAAAARRAVSVNIVFGHPGRPTFELLTRPGRAR